MSRVADDLRLGLDESGVADSQTVEEVHEDDDDQEDEGQQKELAEDCANMTILKD